MIVTKKQLCKKYTIEIRVRGYTGKIKLNLIDMSSLDEHERPIGLDHPKRIMLDYVNGLSIGDFIRRSNQFESYYMPINIEGVVFYYNQLHYDKYLFAIVDVNEIIPDYGKFIGYRSVRSVISDNLI